MEYGMSNFAVTIKIILILTTYAAFAQKVGFLNSDTLREKFPEILQAQHKVQSLTDEWKRELDSMQLKADNLEFEIKKNRHVWNETELQNKEKELDMLKKTRENYARTIFEPNVKYDRAVDSIYSPVEEKINHLLEND